jgi:hypothetical protein
MGRPKFIMKNVALIELTKYDEKNDCVQNYRCLRKLLVSALEDLLIIVLHD